MNFNYWLINLLCRKLNSPTTVGNAVKIATPTYDWEKIGANVNEGPGTFLLPKLFFCSNRIRLSAFMYHSGRTFMTYSASNCAGTGYKLGLIELTGSDPLNPSSWTKASAPVFQTANGCVYCASYYAV